MSKESVHTFHIPVMGLGYTIDTPVKVARFGISSVVSIIEDELIEKMREHYYKEIQEPYIPILSHEHDSRAKRITDYLNLLNKIVNNQVNELKKLPFEGDTEIVQYFELLPDNASLKLLYHSMLELSDGPAKQILQNTLRSKIVAGKIDVNIMSKLDRNNYKHDGEPLPQEYSDALSALRGFANSHLDSSIVFSAGYNPRLYAYVENFADFFPDENGFFRKKIVLKVSDFRSALIQGKIFAKKGIWVSEFRIESGLNCGGHAFPTEGYLLGPILEEFKCKRKELQEELSELCNAVWLAKGLLTEKIKPELWISAQGGIGTAKEDTFLRQHYNLVSTGWGSPFLLVPEATNVDEQTLAKLVAAKKEDYYLSMASPLGIPFNNFRHSSSEAQRLTRVQKNRPGSPCYKKYLASDTEFTPIPICTASREYQELKIKQVRNTIQDETEQKLAISKIEEKDCLCEGLGAAALLKSKLKLSHKLHAVAICPGPNLAYFSKLVSLKEMIGHIYGRISILNNVYRPHVFINELVIYIDYLKDEIASFTSGATTNQCRYLQKFKSNLLTGITYYLELLPSMKMETGKFLSVLNEELISLRIALMNVVIPEPVSMIT